MNLQIGTGKTTKSLSCNFCFKNKSDLAFLFCSKNSYICNLCISICCKLLELQKESFQNNKNYKNNNLFPSEIHKKLCEKIIGQDKALKTISTAIFNHFQRVKFNLNPTEKNSEKFSTSNILLIGSTGIGKTFTIKQLSRILDCPIAMADATTLTEIGYVGDDVESVLLKLLQEAEFDIKKAEKGIVFIDEIDKLSKKSTHSHMKDISGESVQYGLLKMLEGHKVSVSEKKIGGKVYTVDTSNILFICGGVFSGINNIIAKRISNKCSINRVEEDTHEELKGNLLDNIHLKDLQEYGLIPEFLGRFPIIINLKDLSLEDYRKILLDSETINFYKKMLQNYGITFTLTEEAIQEIIKKVFVLKIGARGLKSVLEKMFNNLVFNINHVCNKNFIINEDFVHKAFENIF